MVFFFIQVEALYVFQSNLFLLMKYLKQIFLWLLSVRFLPNYNFSFSFNLNNDCWQSQIPWLSSFRWAKILTRKEREKFDVDLKMYQVIF